ncbi:MAG: hypothetical protein C4558_03590 [Dehalococcoidia bacterium]|nr:MAG: hypothetical protein C4558_03590 [Dehalococcoidia bacterium]
MILVGQSLQFRRGALAGAFAQDNRALVAASARAQVEAGAQALDLNFGIDPPPDEIPWGVAAVRSAVPELPLWIDAGRPSTLTAALQACARDGVAGPLVVNSLPTGMGMSAADEALIRATAAAAAGLVVSPRRVDRDGIANSEVGWVMHEASQAADRALALGVLPPLYFDALVYPALLDPQGVRRSLALLRVFGARPEVTPLAAVGNIAFGAPQSVAVPLRIVYAAAATGAGAGALILPTEDAACVRAVRLALGEVEPADAGEAWLCDVAAWTARNEPLPPAPEEYREAARLIFDAERPLNTPGML